MSKEVAPQETIDQLVSKFEESVHETEDSVQFWLGSDLQDLLGYSDSRNFSNAVDKAKTACGNSGQPIENHFVDITKMVSIGSGAERELPDLMLTRYACYLTAQNGDARKKQVAFAQTYFAIQTRRQELADQAGPVKKPLTEDQRRVLLRDEIKGHNKQLSSAARSAGVITSNDFATFHSEGYKGLYGGRTKAGIQKYKRLSPNQEILDHIGSTELAANMFRLTQTEEKLRNESIKGKEMANLAHFEVGRRVRQTMRETGGTMPEDLPVAEHVKEARKRLTAEGKKRLK